MLYLQNFLIILIFTVSCQVAQTSRQERSLASKDLTVLLIKELARESKSSKGEVERQIIAYIKKSSPQQLGLSKLEISQLKNLSNDLPFTPKVIKWSGENLAKIFPKLSKKSLIRIYENSYVKNRGGKNIYNHKGNPHAKLDDRGRRLFQLRKIRNELKALKLPGVEKRLNSNLNIITARGKADPLIMSNGNHIIISAKNITLKTGLNSIGANCHVFLKTAPKEIFAMKANVDIVRAQIVDQMALRKNQNKPFIHFSEIPVKKRLIQEELDLATKEALKQVLGHTDENAILALKVLKKNPCKMY